MTTLDALLTYLGRKFNTDFHYFAKGGFWLLLTQGITIVGSLIVASIFAKTLSEQDYGVYRYLISLSVLFTTFSLTGIGQSIFQTAAKGHTEFFPYGIKISLLYNTLITASSLTGAAYYYLNGNMLLALGCVFIAFLQPLISTYQNILPFLQGLKLFKKSSINQAIRVTLITTASVTAIYFTHNILILFFVFLLSQAVSNIFGSLFFSRMIDKKIALQEEIRIKYLRYAQHISIQNIIVGLATRLDSILIFQQLGAANLAFFSIATLLPDQARGACKNLLALLIPKFAKYDTIHKNRENIPLRSLQFFMILLAVSVMLILVLPSIYSLLFPKYLNVIYYSQLLLLALPASVALIPFSALQSHLKDKELYNLNIYSSLIQIISTITLIPLFGLIGAIVARIISGYVTTFLTFYFLFKAK